MMNLIKLSLLAALLAAPQSVLAEKPDPIDNPPLQVREQNLDEVTQAIRVREQGTVNVDIIEGEELDVNVTGGQIDANITNSSVTVDGTVSVDNFPSAQDVYVFGGQLSSPTRLWSDIVEDDPGGDVVEIWFGDPPIYATTINISSQADEWAVIFATVDTLASSGYPLRFWNNAGAETITESFIYPIPLNGFRLQCLNESDPCSISVSVFGFGD